MKKGMTLRQIQEWKPPKRMLTPDRAERCEQRLGLVVDEAMRNMEEW